MINYYSQHGEDVLLHEMFKNKQEGFFVEVGCIDGRRFSNTLLFEKQGWKGICIEAHNDFIPLLRQNRPNSVVCHCAVGEADENDVPFYANARGSLSTLDRSMESQFKKTHTEYFTGFEVQQVKKCRLDSVFKENKVRQIDILSLDIEGYEVMALKGLDLNVYQPKIMVVETDMGKQEAELDNLILPFGYSKLLRLAGNVFYFLDSKLFENIREKSFEVKLLHTEHPIDRNGDALVDVSIITKSRFLPRMIEQLMSRLAGRRIFTSRVLRH